MIRARVESARERQRTRFDESRESRVENRRTTHESRFSSLDSRIVCNADMRIAEIRQYCKLDGAGESLIRAAMGQMNLSARGYHRVLKLARTIADLAGCENILAAHLAEAIQYRPRVM